MCELENSNLANLAIQRATIRACLDLATLFVNSFANLRSAEVVEIRASKLFQERSFIGLLE